jgi:hypothetical protein
MYRLFQIQKKTFDLAHLFFEISDLKVSKKPELSFSNSNFCEFFVENANFEPSFL